MTLIIPRAEEASKGYMVHTQGLQCSSFLLMTYLLLRDYNILPKKELHLSLWVYHIGIIGGYGIWP